MGRAAGQLVAASAMADHISSKQAVRRTMLHSGWTGLSRNVLSCRLRVLLSTAAWRRRPTASLRSATFMWKL